MKRNRPVHIISLFSWKLQTIRLFMLWLPLLLSPVAMAEDKTCPVVKLPMERLPDMNVPRGGHALFCINGELTVIGGHTTGFVITQSAEYFADGKWHPMNPVYAHDDGAYKVLRSGKVLLYGGHERNLGIGQSYEVEMYDPVNTHSEASAVLTKNAVWPHQRSSMTVGSSSQATGIMTMALRYSMEKIPFRLSRT
ncbi:MAG: hypothetical protein ACTTKN_00055 [Phocaeicola sp.]|uniref:hypothetical protein n=1 Tax=Phocaeicola sp. TaxID=2773926 RepID=UPI003F9FC109